MGFRDFVLKAICVSLCLASSVVMSSNEENEQVFIEHVLGIPNADKALNSVLGRLQRSKQHSVTARHLQARLSEDTDCEESSEILPEYTESIQTSRERGLRQLSAQRYGIDGALLRVLQSTYDGCTACVHVDGTLSPWFDVTIGVKQSCVLSARLFILYLDNCLQEIRFTNIGLRMDDVVKHYPICRLERRIRKLNTIEYEYRPAYYEEVLCSASTGGGDIAANEICSSLGFSCVQWNKTIHLTRRRYSSDCWETRTLVIPAGCECMWPVHRLGDISLHV